MRPEDKRFLLRSLELVTTISVNLAACIAVGVLGGRWLDQELNTGPWFTAFGAILGVVSGFWSIYKRVVGKRDS